MPNIKGIRLHLVIPCGHKMFSKPFVRFRFANLILMTVLLCLQCSKTIYTTTSKDFRNMESFKATQTIILNRLLSFFPFMFSFSIM